MRKVVTQLEIVFLHDQLGYGMVHLTRSVFLEGTTENAESPVQARTRLLLSSCYFISFFH
jgi:hypothetical protein